MGSKLMNCFPEQSQWEQDIPNTLYVVKGKDEPNTLQNPL